MRQNINIKNFKGIFFLLLVVVLVSSCNRGGYGCPYELEAAVDAFRFLGK